MNIKAQIPLSSTRHVRRVEPMHFGCVELVEQHSSTRSTGSTRNLVCCVVYIKLYNVSYSLI